MAARRNLSVGYWRRMSRDDVEFLRGVYEEWGRGDYSREFFASDVVSHGYGFVDLDGRQEGLENVIEAQREWLRQWERPFSVEAEEFIPSGDLVVVLIRWHGTGRGSGVELEAEGAHVWQLRDGEAVRWDVYRDRAKALADAGVTLGEGGER
jgi:ketosteroid isomerase-like protein